MVVVKITKEDIDEMAEHMMSMAEVSRVGDQFELKSNRTGDMVRFEVVCSDCGGEGTIATDVDDGEGHTMKGVGTQKCHCQS